MRVGIIALQHESNTFVAGRTTLEHFQRDILTAGDDVRERFAGAHHEVGGFFEAIDRERITAVPMFAARALPSGAIDSATAGELIRQMHAALDSAGKVDGLLVAPHGAAVAENHRDFDGHWLTLLRQRVGKCVPIICTLDLHANVSQAMIDACDATLIYRTNPHLDQRQIGLAAGALMARTLRGEVKPTQALAMPPIAINIERQLTDESPSRDLFAFADAQIAQRRLLGNSVALGFPYADVAEMGSAVVAIADNIPVAARAAADELADYMLARRDDFAGRFISFEAALDAIDQSPLPVCLLDTGDNVGGGSPADGTLLASALMKRGRGMSLAMICDGESVAACDRAGQGATVSLRIGGKTDALHGAPIETTARIVHVTDGRWSESQPRHGGHSGGDMGRCAVVDLPGGLTVLLTTHRTAPFSLQQLTCVGLQPAAFDVLVAKGVHAPVAAYREVCRRFIRVNTPGVTDADMTRMTFHHRRRPLFPFER